MFISEQLGKYTSTRGRARGSRDEEEEEDEDEDEDEDEADEDEAPSGAGAGAGSPARNSRSKCHAKAAKYKTLSIPHRSPDLETRIISNEFVIKRLQLFSSKIIELVGAWIQFPLESGWRFKNRRKMQSVNWTNSTSVVGDININGSG